MIGNMHTRCRCCDQEICKLNSIALVYRSGKYYARSTRCNSPVNKGRNGWYCIPCTRHLKIENKDKIDKLK